MAQNTYQRELVKHFDAFRYRHDVWQVWRDFCELSALAVSNSVDRAQFDSREARYLDIIGRYDPEAQQRFPVMFATLVQALDVEMGDILGQTFMQLELGSKWKGQFFTPYEVAALMARLTVTADSLAAHVADKGYFTVQEPAVGGGVTIIALADVMNDAGFNYQRNMHVTAIDVDPTCVHMSYLQFALYHIPAVVIHGNTLTLEEKAHWYTPAHIIGGWDYRLRTPATPKTPPPPASTRPDAPELVLISPPG